MSIQLVCPRCQNSSSTMDDATGNLCFCPDCQIRIRFDSYSRWSWYDFSIIFQGKKFEATFFVSGSFELWMYDPGTRTLILDYHPEVSPKNFSNWLATVLAFQ